MLFQKKTIYYIIEIGFELDRFQIHKIKINIMNLDIYRYDFWGLMVITN